jgi:hypothetical protein
MVGSRSSEQAEQIDTYVCLKCETVISLTPPRPRSPKPED